MPVCADEQTLARLPRMLPWCARRDAVDYHRLAPAKQTQE